MAKPKRVSKPRKAKTNPVDLFEVEEDIPQEERQAGQRYDRVENYEYETPSEFEDDEEIDEETAFTEEDKRLYGSWVGEGSKAAGSDEDADEDEEQGKEAGGRELDLLDSDEGDGGDKDDDEEGYNTDDFSEEEPDEEAEQLFKDAQEPDEFDSEAEEEAGGAQDEARYRDMIAAVRGGGDAAAKRRRSELVLSEAYPEFEYNLHPDVATAGDAGRGELSIADLLGGLGDAASRLGPARRELERLARRGAPEQPPLPGPIRARQERKAGYEVAKVEMTKHVPIVKANREAPTLRFALPSESVIKTNSTAALAHKFAPETQMEAEVAALLKAAGADNGKAVAEAEDSLALKELSLEEARERRERLARMRSLLFYHEVKAKRLKGIKSKDYHRRLLRASKARAAREGGGAAGDDGDGDDVIRLAAEQQELERAKERMNLKHKNTSKWARRALKRGLSLADDGTRAAVTEQLRLGEQLRRKVERMNARSGSDTEASSGGGSSGDDESDPNDAAAAQRRTAGKVRAAAMELLQGGEEGADAASKEGLFKLPFMRRAMERHKEQAKQDALQALKEIEEGEAAAARDSDGNSASELEQLDEEPSAAGGGRGGRLRFGASAAAANGGSAGAGRGDGAGSEEGLSSDEDEDAEAKAERLGRQLYGVTSSAGVSGGHPKPSAARHDASGNGTSAARKQRRKGRDGKAGSAEDGMGAVTLAATTAGFVEVGPSAGAVAATRVAASAVAGTAAEGRASGSSAAKGLPTTAGRPSHLFGTANGDSHLGSQQPHSSAPNGTAANGIASAPPAVVSVGPKPRKANQPAAAVPEARNRAAASTPGRTSNGAAAANGIPAADDFVPSKRFAGAKVGYTFGTGPQGLGYYREASRRGPAQEEEGNSSSDEEAGGGRASGQLQRSGNGAAEGGEVGGAGRQPNGVVPGGAASDDEEDAEMLEPITKAGGLSQQELVRRAFAGDDVEAGFEADKAAEVGEELPAVEAPSLLPGWGKWANQQREPAWMREERRKSEQKRDAAAANRRDAKMRLVVISERHDKKADKFRTPAVPYPFTSREAYERSIRTPMGPDTNTDQAFRDMTRPKVQKVAGVIIQPLKYSQPLSAAAAERAAPEKRRAVAVVSAATGMPKRAKVK